MNGWLCFFGDFRTVEYWSPLETHKVVRERIWKILVNLVQIVEVCFPDLCTFSLPLLDRWAMQPLASLGRKFKIQRFPHPLRWNRTNQNFASICHPPIHLRNMRVYPQGRDPANLIFFNLLHLVINSNYWAITQKKNPLHCLFSTNWLLFQKYVPFQMRLQVSVSGSHLQSEQEGGETAFIWGFPQHLILCFLSTILPLIIS